MNLRDAFNIAMGFSFMVTLISCSSLPVEELPVEDLPVEEPPGGANQNWVVVTQKQAEDMNVGSWLVESDGYWTPSADDIYKLEEGLGEYLRQNSSYFYQQPPAWERLEEYQRQYIGLQRGGRQIIYGNFFCNNMGMDWQEKLVIVDDGGDCYFQIEYDITDAAFIMLMVNGVS